MSNKKPKALFYQPELTNDWYQRMAMVEAFEEGCELEDLVRQVGETAQALTDLGHDDDGEVVLKIAEYLCKDYCEWLRDEGEDWQIADFPGEVFKHFMNGEAKPGVEEVDGPPVTGLIKCVYCGKPGTRKLMTSDKYNKRILVDSCAFHYNLYSDK